MGKTLTVSEFDLQFGKEDHLLDVYAVFKQEKKTDILAIYSDRNDDNKATLHYASVHLNPDKIVFIDIKNKEEIVKEFTWKMLNNKENEGFEIIDISKYTKAEIISSNSLLVKPEVIKILFNKTIPKVTKKADNNNNKKNNSSAKIILTGFLLVIIVAVAFAFTHMDLITGTSIKYICKNAYLDTQIGSNKEEIQELTFSVKNELTTLTIRTNFKFNSYEEYKEFDNGGTYFKWEPRYTTSKIDYERDDTKNILSVVEYVTLDKYYSGKTTKNELIEELTKNNYECQDVSE